MNSPSEHHFTIQKQARYYTLGSARSKDLLYVIHGYGQLASFFIKKFEALSNKYFIVAPEGMHRFYLNGFSGRVGASWMTKEDRLTDIEDYIHFLNQLHKDIMSRGHFENIYVLGFSQGVATMFRWLDRSELIAKKVLICSGMIPPDVDMSLEHLNWTDTDWHYITGDDDPFRNEKEVQDFIEEFKRSNTALSTTVFKGGHKINIEAVLSALESAS